MQISLLLQANSLVYLYLYLFNGSLQPLQQLLQCLFCGSKWYSDMVIGAESQPCVCRDTKFFDKILRKLLRLHTQSRDVEKNKSTSLGLYTPNFFYFGHSLTNLITSFLEGVEYLSYPALWPGESSGGSLLGHVITAQ